MIEALLNGKCIAGDNGEYVTFIEMEWIRKAGAN